jgi:hypothetical protein
MCKLHADKPGGRARHAQSTRRVHASRSTLVHGFHSPRPHFRPAHVFGSGVAEGGCEPRFERGRQLAPRRERRYHRPRALSDKVPPAAHRTVTVSVQRREGESRAAGVAGGRWPRAWTSHSLTNGAVLRTSVTGLAHFVMRCNIAAPRPRANLLILIGLPPTRR